MEKQFTIITSHGKLEFLRKEDGKFELISAKGNFVSKNEDKGKLGNQSKEVVV